MVEIHEDYEEFVPQAWYRDTVERLLASVGPEHLAGLRSVVLTHSARIGRGKTGRVGGRKFDRTSCRGFYHAKWSGQPAWIQLVMDNIVMGYPNFLLRFQFLRDSVVGEVLYHEVGHHLQNRVGSTGRGDEGAAEHWCKQLSRTHTRRHYMYLRPVALVLKPIVSFCLRLVHTLTGRSQ